MRVKRLHILLGIAALLAVCAVLLWRSGEEVPAPTLTVAEITSLDDFELMRRIRLDLLARHLAGPQRTAPPADRLPVASTVAFEDDLAGVGPAAAIDGNGGVEALAAAYTELGASAVADCLRRKSPVGPALAKAGLEKRRAAWVRQHAEAFVGR